MSNSYEGDKNRDPDEIDFEEFLTEPGELDEKPGQEKPPANSGSSRLIAALGDRLNANEAMSDQAKKDRISKMLGSGRLENDSQANNDRGNSDRLSKQLGSSNWPIDTQDDSDLADDAAESVIGAAEGEQAGSGRLSDELLQEADRSRIVERMASSTRQKLIVAFQGERGAYSEQALHNFFGPDVSTLPCTDFRGIFDAIHGGKAQRGILPVENSLAGTVSAAYDQLADHDLRIQGEVILRVEHCLMGPAGLKVGDIKRVKSHPQALAQCEQTLRRMGVEAIVHYDTAGAARDLAAQPEPGTAAIASALAAKTYGLEILSHHLEDEPLNYTRFFILGLSDPPREDPSKTSVIFTTRHQPGALHRVLSELAERNINLTKIESRPRRNRPWHYLFYMDFEGHEDQREVREALLGILKQASFLKVLGSYPAAPIPAGDQELDRSG